MRAWWLAISLLVGCGSGPAVPEDDAGGGGPCSAPTDCDDGRFCNGAETCSGGLCAAGGAPCLASQTCDEEANRCAADCAVARDADGDGVDATDCGGLDCDDADPARYAGNAEVCDAADHDEDCDPATYGVRDADGDGAPDGDCCNEGPSGPVCGDDCDDARAGVHPDVPEVCNGIDDDCDGSVDEEVGGMVWPDADGDMFGDGSATPVTGCAGPGLATNPDDCDDARASVNPATTEVCNGVDDDCNGMLDGPGEDLDGDGHANPSCALAAGDDCDDANASIHPGGTETCDGVDEDCDGVRDFPIAEPCVSCGGYTTSDPLFGCSGATPVCCGTGSGGPPVYACTMPGACEAYCMPPTNVRASAACDGTSDCPSGQVCCLSMPCGPLATSQARCAASCDPAYTACHGDADCPAGRTCAARAPLDPVRRCSGT